MPKQKVFNDWQLKIAELNSRVQALKDAKDLLSMIDKRYDMTRKLTALENSIRHVHSDREKLHPPRLKQDPEDLIAAKHDSLMRFLHYTDYNFNLFTLHRNGYIVCNIGNNRLFNFIPRFFVVIVALFGLILIQ